MVARGVLLRFLPIVLIVTGVLALAQRATGADTPSVDHAAWREDFAQIRAAMAAHDANLEWSVRTRHLDLAKMVKATDAELDAADTDKKAQRVLEDFLSSFDDGHLVLTWPTAPSASTTTMTTEEPPADLCARQGYGPPPRHSGGVDFSALPAYAAVPSTGSRLFPIGTLHLASGAIIGILRIPVFGAQWYPELCSAVLPRLGLSPSSACDDACGDRVQFAADNLLTRQYGEAIEKLKRARIVALVVDLTANGGGSNWLEPAARELTAHHLIAQHRAFVRSRHWVQAFQQQRTVALTDLSTAKGKYRQLLQRSALLAAVAARAAGENCDRAPLWDDVPVTCNQVADVGAFTTGILGWAAPGSLPHVPSAEDIFFPSVYSYREGVYRGPLFVLVDGNTASAAERFAAIFQDNRQARIVGQRTFGAGCGYTNGGIPTTLGYSHATLEMADCVEVRADGSNAVAGITPDLLVPWRNSDLPAQRAERVADALDGVLR